MPSDSAQPQQQQPSWRHHYIPEFYLKRWASGKGTLVQFSKPNPHDNVVKAKRVYPRQTGFIDRLYELRGLSPEWSQSVETEFFKPVDTMAANVLAKMEARQFEFSDKERSAWSDFLMSLILRHPHYVRGLPALMIEELSQPLRQRRKLHLMQGDRRLDSKRTVAELGTNEGIARVAMATLARSIRSAKTGAALINLQWGLFFAPISSPALLTSDCPVYWSNGLSDPNFHLLLPIGPRTVFWAAPFRSSAGGVLRDERQAGRIVADLNDHVTRRAKQYVYSLSDSPLRYVQDRMGVDPVPTLPDLLLQLARRRSSRDRGA